MGEPDRQLLHAPPDIFGGLEGIGTGQLVDRQSDRRLAVEGAAGILVFRPQFAARHVVQADDLSLGAGLDDYLAELLGFDQPAQRTERVLKILPGWNRLLTDLSGRNLY